MPSQISLPQPAASTVVLVMAFAPKKPDNSDVPVRPDGWAKTVRFVSKRNATTSETTTEVNYIHFQ